MTVDSSVGRGLAPACEIHGFLHTGTEKLDFFPFTCGYMEIEL